MGANKRNEVTDEDGPEAPYNSDKEKTIIRNMEREQKTKETKTGGDME